MSKDRLLSDEELKEKVSNKIYPYHFVGFDKKRYEALDEGEKEVVDEWVDLINTQKRLYAESVIGEDEDENKYGDRERKRYYNELRAEQRARIK